MLTTDTVCLFLSSVWTQQETIILLNPPLGHQRPFHISNTHQRFYDVIRTEKNAPNRVSANSNPYSPLKRPIGTKEHGRTKLQQYSECALRELEYAQRNTLGANKLTMRIALYRSRRSEQENIILKREFKIFLIRHSTYVFTYPIQTILMSCIVPFKQRVHLGLGSNNSSKLVLALTPYSRDSYLSLTML